MHESFSHRLHLLSHVHASPSDESPDLSPDQDVERLFS